jgi:hypothetical protein
LGGFRLCDSDFGITAVDDITVGITCAAFCFQMAHISFASSWTLVLLLLLLLYLGLISHMQKVFHCVF